jgi:hypothetical protein
VRAKAKADISGERQRAHRDDQAEKKRRAEVSTLRDVLGHLRAARSALESLNLIPEADDLLRPIQKTKIRIWQLEEYGCAEYAVRDENEDQGAHRIMRARGQGRVRVQREIFGEEEDFKFAADKAGMRERKSGERERIDRAHEERERRRSELAVTEQDLGSPDKRAALESLYAAVKSLPPSPVDPSSPVDPGDEGQRLRDDDTAIPHWRRLSDRTVRAQKPPTNRDGSRKRSKRSKTLR